MKVKIKKHLNKVTHKIGKRESSVSCRNMVYRLTNKRVRQEMNLVCKRALAGEEDAEIVSSKWNGTFWS